MNNIQIFENKEFGEIRTIIKDNEPLFCLADVCKALEISNPSKVAQRLDDDERTKLELGRAGETNFITESGELQLKGQDIAVISEDVFYEMIGMD